MTVRMRGSTRLVPPASLAVLEAVALVRGNWVGVGFFGLGLVAALLFTLRPKVQADAEGITVVNLRTHRVPWVDVSDLSQESPRFGLSTYLTIHRRGAPPIRAWALTTGRGGYDPEDFVRFASELRRRLTQATA